MRLKSLTQWQKEYPDVIKATVKSKDPMNEQECRNLANGFFSKESSILQCKITGKKVVMYVSKKAFQNGVQDSAIIIG